MTLEIPMKLPAPLIIDSPPLADETVREMLALLYQLIATLEPHYARPSRPDPDAAVSPQSDWFDDPNHGDPPF